MSEKTYPSVNDLTLEEKASLTSGGDAWHLQGVEAKGIPGYMMVVVPVIILAIFIQGYFVKFG